MPDAASTEAAGKQPVVSPESGPASPSPVSDPQQPLPEQRAAQQPVSPVTPKIAQPQPVHAPQQHHVFGMQPATLYAEPVEPRKTAESVTWMRMKLFMVAAALVLALAAMGLSLGTLKFPLKIIATQTYSFIGSTIPLVSRGTIYSLKPAYLTWMALARPRHSLEHCRARDTYINKG